MPTGTPLSRMMANMAGLLRASLLAIVASVVIVGSAHAQCDCPAALIEAIGHRGTGEDTDDNPFPENTIPSFEQAVLEGATMVELDVHHSADGVLVVIHNDTVDRTTDGVGCVGDLTLAELQSLDAGGAGLPTLAEVFAAVSVGINIEIKVNEDASCPATDLARMAADVVSAIAADGSGRDVLVSSFDLEQLLEVRAADDTVALALLTVDTDGIDVAIEQDFEAVHPLALAVRAADVTRAHDAGLEVNPWTVNDVATIRRLAGFGVDRIITDEPEVVPTAIAAYCDSLTCDDAGDGGCAVTPRSTPQPSVSLLLLLLCGLFRLVRSRASRA